MTVRWVSRELIGLRLDNSDAGRSKVGISWKILEPGDEFILQIVYAGAPGAHVHADGAIEGMSAARRPPVSFPAPVTLAGARRSAVSTAALYVLLSVLGIAAGVLNLRIRSASPIGRGRVARWVLKCYIAANLALAVYGIVRAVHAVDGPPFAF